MPWQLLDLKQAKFLPPNGIQREIYQRIFFTTCLF
jgi:hypothetical protein